MCVSKRKRRYKIGQNVTIEDNNFERKQVLVTCRS